MSGQAIVTINNKQWTVSIANTYTELTSGLSGVASITAGSGILFDLGSDRSYIEINMLQMLFPLDIVFINSTQGVVGVMHNVQPGATDVRFENNALPGARCFLEVNAGEAEGIEVGDSVNIQGYAQPSMVDIPGLASSIFTGITIFMFIFMMGRMAMKTLEAPAKTPALKEGRKPSSEEISLEEKRHSLEETGKKIAEQAGKGVRFVELEKGWQPKYATVRYWFKDSEGNRIIATDLDELKWKLSLESLPQTKHHSPGEKIWYLGEYWEEEYSTAECVVYRSADGKKRLYVYRDGTKEVKPAPQYLPETKFNPGEIVMYKGEKVRVSEQIGDRVNIFIPSRQELVWVKPEKLEKIEGAEPTSPELLPQATEITPEEQRFAEALWENTKKLVEEKDPYGIHIWRMLVHFYPGNKSKQVSTLGFMNEIYGRYGRGPIPHEELVKSAKKWGVEKMLVEEMIRFLPQLQGQLSKVIPVEKYPRRETDLEYLADSPEFLTQTIEAIGYRDKLDTAFQEAIARAKGLK